MDREVWHAVVHGVAKSQTWLSELNWMSVELKSFLTRSKEESERASLKLNIKKSKTMASGLITSQQIEGEKEEAVTDFLFLGSKITADSKCSHEIRGQLLLDRKAMTNLGSVLKRRNITLSMEICIVQAMVFPVIMYGFESWTIKKAELPENWWLLTVVLEKTLESLLDSKETAPFNLKGDQPWIFTRRTDTEAPVLVIWYEKTTHWKIPEAGKDHR